MKFVSFLFSAWSLLPGTTLRIDQESKTIPRPAYQNSVRVMGFQKHGSQISGCLCLRSNENRQLTLFSGKSTKTWHRRRDGECSQIECSEGNKWEPIASESTLSQQVCVRIDTLEARYVVDYSTDVNCLFIGFGFARFTRFRMYSLLAHLRYVEYVGL